MNRIFRVEKKYPFYLLNLNEMSRGNQIFFCIMKEKRRR